MYVYILMSALVILLGYQEAKVYATYGYCDRKKKCISRKNIYYKALVLLFLFVGGFRFRVGTDFGAYASRNYCLEFDALLHQIFILDEPGVYIITTICRTIWDEGVFVIFVENMLITLLIFKGIRKYQFKNLTMPILLYMFAAGWTFSFNGVRQAFAAAIIFAFSDRTKKNKKYKICKYCMVIFVAFLFHRSSIFMLPVLLIAERKVDGKQIILIALLSILIPLLGDMALEFMGGINKEASIYFNTHINPLRVIISFAPVLLVLLFYEKRQYIFINKQHFLINMILLDFILTFATANSAHMNRFTMYTSNYVMVFIPLALTRMNRLSRKISGLIIVLLYFIVFLVEIQKNGNLLPFQWCFGHLGEY